MNTNYGADDKNLKHDLEEHVLNNFKRAEVLEYTWSIRTLDRRLCYFNISSIDYQRDVDTVRAVVQKQVCRPGQLFDYRVINQKLRFEHQIKVPCNL